MTGIVNYNNSKIVIAFETQEKYFEADEDFRLLLGITSVNCNLGST